MGALGQTSVRGADGEVRGAACLSSPSQLLLCCRQSHHPSCPHTQPSTFLALFPDPWHSPRVPESLRVQVTTALFTRVQGCSLEDPLGQEMRRDSFPTHCSSPSHMALSPSPK